MSLPDLKITYNSPIWTDCCSLIIDGGTYHYDIIMNDEVSINDHFFSHLYKPKKNYKMWSSTNKMINKTHKCLRTVIRLYFIYKFSTTPTYLNFKFYLYYIIWTKFIQINSESNKKCD